MLFVFDVEGQQYRINPEPAKLTGAELVAVERNTGLGMVDFVEALKNPRGSAAGISALVWLARRRAGDYVKWSEFIETFHPLTISLEAVDDEPAEASEPTEPEPVAEQRETAAPKPRSRSRAPRAKAS